MASSLLMKFALFAAIIGCAYSVGIYEQCAGEGYRTVPCNAGLTCFRRNKWYSSCQFSCPRHVGWECEAQLPPLPVGTVAAAWEKCGGEGWLGPKTCVTGFVCYTRSVHFSQCRPIGDCPPGWTCPVIVTTTTTPSGPIILSPYEKCNGLVNTICPVGTACFRNSDVYSECRPSCPKTWACETDVVGANEQCGGEDYVGITRCAEGLRCYARNKWYSHCAASCPGAEWVC